MNILKMTKEILRDKEKEKRKNFMKRRDAFFEEYKLLASKYKCDWNPFITVDKFGQQAKPQLEIIDATEFLEKENNKESENNEDQS